ncbi:MAG: hypothetical protein ABSA30_07365 [Candidatus Aminicenantales bacterium]|jgi:hypothetical protein
MNAERALLRRAAAAVLAGAVCVAAAAGQTADRPAPPSAVRSLIRKEWLKTPIEPPVPPRRDIFSPQGAPSVDERGFRPGPVRSAVLSAEKKAEEEARPVFALRYIGFSRSAASKKIVALVLIDSQAQAVEEGDTLGAGYKVTRITVKEIEIHAPDGTAIQFALEGAER